jgi:transposase
LVKQQTMLVNAMRGSATEFGLTVPQGIGKLGEFMVFVDADEYVPEQARLVIRELLEHCSALAGSLKTFEEEIVAHARRDDTARPWRRFPALVRSPRL